MHHDFGYDEEGYETKGYDWGLLVRLAGYLNPYRRYLALSMVFLVVITGVELALPYLTKVAIDDYILNSARKVDLPADNQLAVSFRTDYESLLVATRSEGVFFIHEKEVSRIDPRMLHEVRERGWMDEARFYPAPLDTEVIGQLNKNGDVPIVVGLDTAFIPFEELKNVPPEELAQLRTHELQFPVCQLPDLPLQTDDRNRLELLKMENAGLEKLLGDRHFPAVVPHGCRVGTMMTSASSSSVG